MQTDSTSFGERLLLSIEICGMTQTGFSEKSGIDRFHINHFVRDRRMPDFYSLRTILTALPAVDARWLITGSGSPTNPRSPR